MLEPLSLQFRAPDNVEDALDVISHVSIFLDFWASRAGEWEFLQLLAKSADLSIWHCVSKCVMTQSGKNLQEIDFAQLGTQGVLEALAVFCQGLMDMQVPQIYLRHCAGISTQSIIDLVKDMQKVKEECQNISDPHALFSHILAKALSGSL